MNLSRHNIVASIIRHHLNNIFFSNFLNKTIQKLKDLFTGLCVLRSIHTFYKHCSQ
ncbi:hypothetical protein Fmac_016235 [Flemingia macrophylla]|uniref:Uncharacterized protein n=1 Tax=Flemingia macrophylla TaxID=520843 RepID=A0ABD1MGT2_9FABA